MARIVPRLHPETRQRGASQNYSPFPWSTTRFCRLSPESRESLHDFLKRGVAGWKREYGFPVSKKLRYLAIYVAKSLFVHATVRVIKFIPSILILKGNFYSFENIYCVIFFFFSESLPRISKQSDILIAMNEKNIYIYKILLRSITSHVIPIFRRITCVFKKQTKKKKNSFTHFNLDSFATLYIRNVYHVNLHRPNSKPNFF